MAQTTAPPLRATWTGPLRRSQGMIAILDSRPAVSVSTSLDSKDQEDEHSCFSDNTKRDMVQDVQGVVNVWTGSYTKLDGTVIEGAAFTMR